MDALQRRHMETLKTGVENLYQDTEMTDVIIKVNNRLFPCHKTVLAAVSPYFKSMFSTGMKESREHKITLQDMNEVAFDKFLKFVYTGKEDVIGEDVTEMLRMAAIFQVDCLQARCEEILVEELRNENCLEMFSLGVMYNCQQLRTRAWATILDGFCTVWKQADFDALPYDEVVKIFREDSLVTLDEEHVCEAAFKWMNYDLEKRKQYAYQLFKQIRLPHVSPEYLVNTLCRNKILTESTDCRILLDEAKDFLLLPARRTDFSSPRMPFRQEDDLEEVLLVITEYNEEKGSFYQGGWCLWAFSFDQKRWFTLAPVPLTDSPGNHFAICSYAYDLYLSGGTSNPKSLLKFESERNEWVTHTGTLKKGRCHHSMVAVGHSLYCLAGKNTKLQKPNQCMGHVEEFYIPGNRWRTVGELPTPVHSCVSAVIGEDIFVFGGITNEDAPTNVVQHFQTRLKNSCIISHLPYTSPRLFTTTMGSTIYITTVDSQGNGILRMTSDLGFEDPGFELPSVKRLLGITHHNEKFVCLDESVERPNHLGRVIKLNLATNKLEEYCWKGDPGPKPIHACQRSFVDKRFLYHTYFQ